MKNTKAELIPLTANDRERFIPDIQWSFKHGALYEFGKRDNHIDADGEESDEMFSLVKVMK